MAAKTLSYYKWTIFGTMYIGYTMYMWTRKTFAFAMPTIMKVEGLDKEDLGLITSSQNLAYALSKFVGGVVADKSSPKVMFATGLLFSGLISLAFSVSSSVWVFASLWFLIGFLQGGGWPACAKLLRMWFPASEFGTWWGVLSTSMNVACSAGPIVTTMIIFNLGSWRASFQLPGVVTLVVAFLSLMLIVNSPDEVGFSSYGGGQKDDKGKTTPRGRGTWKDLLSSPLMGILCAGYLVISLVKTAALDWGQLYLIQELGHTQYVGSSFTSTLEAGGIFGSIMAGYVADKAVLMVKRENTQGSPRIMVLVMLLMTAVLFFYLVVFTFSSSSSYMWITGVAFSLGFSLYGSIALYGIMATEAAPAHLSGTSHAIAALASNSGNIIAGLPLSLLAKHYNWSGSFMVLEGALIMSFIMHLLTRNTEYKLVPIKKKMN